MQIRSFLTLEIFFLDDRETLIRIPWKHWNVQRQLDVSESFLRRNYMNMQKFLRVGIRHPFLST